MDGAVQMCKFFLPAVFLEDRSDSHSDEKNVKLIKHLIEISSNEGDIIADFFVGSAPVPIACIETKRKFIGYEINKDYFDLAQDRIEKKTSPKL